jgi:hypothetical protein
MVRQIVVPDEPRLSIDLPQEYVGRSVEVIAFPLNEPTHQFPEEPSEAEREAKLERLRKSLEGLTYNSGGYTFNREDANDYD